MEMRQMRKTKTRLILEFIRDNEPVKATAICEAILKKKHMPAIFGAKAYFYYPGWSGFRAYLTRWSIYDDKTKQAIVLTSKGYALTEYGRGLLK
jgi:hypothetical protein